MDRQFFTVSKNVAPGSLRGKKSLGLVEREKRKGWPIGGRLPSPQKHEGGGGNGLGRGDASEIDDVRSQSKVVEGLNKRQRIGPPRVKKGLKKVRRDSADSSEGGPDGSRAGDNRQAIRDGQKPKGGNLGVIIWRVHIVADISTSKGSGEDPGGGLKNKV